MIDMSGDPLLVVWKNGSWTPYKQGESYASDNLAWPVFVRWSVFFGKHRPPPSEHQSGASQNAGGQPKAGGLQNRECLGVMDDPEHATGEKI